MARITHAPVREWTLELTDRERGYLRGLAQAASRRCPDEARGYIGLEEARLLTEVLRGKS